MCAYFLHSYPPTWFKTFRANSDVTANLEVEEHSAQRQKSRNRIIAQARANIEEDLENQRVRSPHLWIVRRSCNKTLLQVATDAAALIKHYKALLSL